MLSSFRKTPKIVNKATKHSAQRNISGARIRAARLTHRPPLTQERLAQWLRHRGLNIGQATLARMENHERGVLDIELKAIARRLKTSIGWLCGERGAKR